MNGSPYYKAYPTDFLRGTIGMPFDIKCGYRVILDLIYAHGGRLEYDARYIAGNLGCSMRKCNAIISDLIGRDKLYLSDGKIANNRADLEIEILTKRKDNNAENASMFRKNNGLQKPKPSHTDTDTDTEKREAKASLAKPQKSTRLSPDWFLPKEWGDWALGHGLDDDAIRDQADRFRDYFIAQPGPKASKLDWQATWRNWVRNSNSMKGLENGRSGNGQSRSGGVGSGTVDAFAAVAQRIIREQNGGGGFD